MTTEEKKQIYKAVIDTLNGTKVYEGEDLRKLLEMIEKDNKQTDLGITLKKVK